MDSAGASVEDVEENEENAIVSKDVWIPFVGLGTCGVGNTEVCVGEAPATSFPPCGGGREGIPGVTSVLWRPICKAHTPIVRDSDLPVNYVIKKKHGRIFHIPCNCESVLSIRQR